MHYPVLGESPETPISACSDSKTSHPPSNSGPPMRAQHSLTACPPFVRPRLVCWKQRSDVVRTQGSAGMRFTGGAGGGKEGEGAKEGRRNRNRTEHQQNLNKLAQQRYRERKKQKVLQTEQAAAQLASKLANPPPPPPHTHTPLIPHVCWQKSPPPPRVGSHLIMYAFPPA